MPRYPVPGKTSSGRELLRLAALAGRPPTTARILVLGDSTGRAGLRRGRGEVTGGEWPGQQHHHHGQRNATHARQTSVRSDRSSHEAPRFPRRRQNAPSLTDTSFEGPENPHRHQSCGPSRDESPPRDPSRRLRSVLQGSVNPLRRPWRRRVRGVLGRWLGHFQPQRRLVARVRPGRAVAAPALVHARPDRPSLPRRGVRPTSAGSSPQPRFGAGSDAGSPPPRARNSPRNSLPADQRQALRHPSPRPQRSHPRPGRRRPRQP